MWTALSKKLGDIVEKWHSLLPNAEILPISAKNKFGTDMLLKRIKELLPESPAFFDKEACPFLRFRDYPRKDFALL